MGLKQAGGAKQTYFFMYQEGGLQKICTKKEDYKKSSKATFLLHGILGRLYTYVHMYLYVH